MCPWHDEHGLQACSHLQNKEGRQQLQRWASRPSQCMSRCCCLLQRRQQQLSQISKISIRCVVRALGPTTEPQSELCCWPLCGRWHWLPSYCTPTPQQTATSASVRVLLPLWVIPSALAQLHRPGLYMRYMCRCPICRKCLSSSRPLSAPGC